MKKANKTFSTTSRNLFLIVKVQSATETSFSIEKRSLTLGKTDGWTN